LQSIIEPEQWKVPDDRWRSRLVVPTSSTRSTKRDGVVVSVGSDVVPAGPSQLPSWAPRT